MKKIKVAFFMESFYPMIDGVTNVADNLAKILQGNQKAEITVFAPRGRDKKYIDNFPYKVVRCKSVKVFFLDYDLSMPCFDSKFKKEIKEGNFDVFHLHAPFAIGKTAVKIAKKLNIPTVINMHSQFKQDFYRATHSRFIANLLTKKIMRVFNACDRCIAVGNGVAELYFNNYKAREFPKVINNATHLKPVSNIEEAYRRVNEAYNLDRNEIVYCFVGRINALKNIFFIADALKIVKDRGQKFKMLFVGSGQDSAKLQKYVDKLDLSDSIILCGRISNQMIVDVYARSHLFLFPSKYDTNSLVQVEAASQKTPTVFVKSVTAATVTPDVNGIIAEETPEDYAEKIIKATTDKEYYNTLSEGCFRDLYKTWDKAAEEYYNEYISLIDKTNLKDK